MSIDRLQNRLIAISVAGIVIIAAVPASAESYSDLQSQGYKTGKMTNGASGALGWYVSNGQKKFFCKLRAANAYVGKPGMVGFTAAGRQIKMDRKTYEQSLGGPDASIPQLSALKAGKLEARHVGGCYPSK